MPILPRRLNKFQLLDVDPLELARQMTIQDFTLYENIHAVEFLQKAWSDKSRNFAPNITALIWQSNRLTAWIAATILDEADAKRRAHLIKHFVLVADKCY